ncbi:MAG: sensor histidine kinase [Thermosynechococcus sp.]|uniref:sensor histidine kinase n=1 Tax=Thermosynechococcus sp. TaxID=2814275 RepID=UPI00391919BD
MEGRWRFPFQGWPRLSPQQRGFLIIVLPVFCLVSTVGIFVWLSLSMSNYEKAVRHSQRVQLEARELLNHLIDAETGIRGYHLTQRGSFLEPYHTALAQLPATLEELETILSYYPQQLANFQHLRALVNRSTGLLTAQMNSSSSNRQPLMEEIEQSKRVMDQTRAAINAFITAEERLLVNRQQQLESLRQMHAIALMFVVVVGFIGTGLAVRLFAELFQELERQRQELEAACNRLSQFTANASHELRAPIAAILSHAQVGILLGQQQPEQALLRLEKVASLAKSMGQLVNDLLFLARHEGVSPPDFTTPLDVGAFIQAIAQEWRETHAQTHRFHLQLPSVPLFIKGDRDMLRQVVLNLLSNAERYTPAGGTITLQVSQQGEEAVIVVSDTGIGISATALPHIFDYFYRDERVQQRGIRGSGLGLAIVRQIIQLHRGSILVESQEDQGSTFTVKLPLAT